MAILNAVISWVIKQEVHQMELFIKYPHDVQQDILQKLLSSAANTEYGKKYDFAHIRHAEDFRQKVPLNTYEDLHPYVVRLQAGEQNLLWHTDIKWFAKSSGTTGNKSKFIPVSEEALTDCHFKGGKDMYAIYMYNYPDSCIFDGMNLAMGGSHHELEHNSDVYYGDLSAILMQKLPFWAEFRRTPNLDIALMNDWESKLEKMAVATMKKNVTNMAGVPSWIALLLQKILDISGKQHILEVWPNMEAFFHGGVNFTPYRDQFQKLIPSPSMHYMETYNASEGFFGIQDQPGSDEMLLMLNYGIYYEFIPMEYFHEENPKTINLDQVELNKNYALVISTNAGLWRYIIGDTVVFTSLKPYRIKISGRTKSYINAFGEEVIEDNALKAIAIASKKANAQIAEFTAAPIFLDDERKAKHQWLIEFEKAPEDLDFFAAALDNALKALNSDYEAKRYHDLMLQMPEVIMLPKGTFYAWMKSKGKLGGQHKVPRLSNHREYVDQILALTIEMK